MPNHWLHSPAEIAAAKAEHDRLVVQHAALTARIADLTREQAALSQRIAEQYAIIA